LVKTEKEKWGIDRVVFEKYNEQNESVFKM